MENSPLERYKKIAWSIASTSAKERNVDPLLIYQRLVERYKGSYVDQIMSQLETKES